MSIWHCEIIFLLSSMWCQEVKVLASELTRVWTSDICRLLHWREELRFWKQTTEVQSGPPCSCIYCAGHWHASMPLFLHLEMGLIVHLPQGFEDWEGFKCEVPSSVHTVSPQIIISCCESTVQYTACWALCFILSSEWFPRVHFITFVFQVRKLELIKFDLAESKASERARPLEQDFHWHFV